MPFHERLKELRLQNNLSQSQLSRNLDMATRTYIYYEKGQRYPSVKLVAKLADYFNVSKSFLMDGQEEGQAQGSKLGAKQLVEAINDLFAGSELSESEKEAVMMAVQEAYQKAKEKNDQA